MPEDFYDYFLRELAPRDNFILGELLSRVISLVRVGDWWLYQRLMKLLEQGEFIEVKPRNERHRYSAVLRRV